MDAIPTHSTRPKRIWLVNLFFGPGLAPTGVLLESLAVDLMSQGWNVEVLASKVEYRVDVTGEPSRFVGVIHRFHCQSKRSGLRGKFLTWVWFYLNLAWFSFRKRLPDVIIVQTTPPFLHTLFALRSLFSWRRPKLVLWNQDTYPESLAATGILPEKAVLYRLLKRVTRWTGYRVHQAVALDGAMEARLRDQGIERVLVIPNWDVAKENRAMPAMTEATSGSLDGMSTVAETRCVLPEGLGEAAAGFRYKIAYTGNLGFAHDLTPLWNYISQNTTQTDFLFLFVGEGARTKQLKEFVVQQGWQCVKFWPYLPITEFSALLDWSDYGLVALEPNCLGLMSPSKMHAWLGAGKPVLYIGPNGSNVTETVRTFDCGFMVDPADLQGFEQVARTILSADFNPAEMQARAKRAWRERHMPEVGLRAWQELLASLEG